jgi:ankyrin repeat protein
VAQILETTYATLQAQNALSMQMRQLVAPCSQTDKAVSEHDLPSGSGLPTVADHPRVCDTESTINTGPPTVPDGIADNGGGTFYPEPVAMSPTLTVSAAGSRNTSIFDKHPDDAASVRSTAMAFSMRSIRSLVPSFQEALKNSRPYKLLRRRGRDSASIFSVESSEKGCTWSMLSDMSLGDLSIAEIAVIELPIYLSDLWDAEPYRVDETLASPSHRTSEEQLNQPFNGRTDKPTAPANDFVVRTQMALGSDIEELDGKGRTPIAHAFNRNQFSIVGHLLEHGASTEPLRAIATSSDLQEKLRGAIDSGNEEVVSLLLDMGVAFNDRLPASPHGMSPLLYAAYKGKLPVVKLLLKKGADIQARDNEGWTVLHCAADSEDAELVQYLLDNGALELLDITATSNTPGDTPLHVAASHNRLPVVKILVERGAHVNQVNKAGNTPYQKARERSPSVAKYLWSQLQPADQAVETPPRH